MFIRVTANASNFPLRQQFVTTENPLNFHLSRDRIWRNCMTSASELFPYWRSRACRTPDPALPDRDHDLRRRNRARRRREGPDSSAGARVQQGAPPARHLCNRLSHPERDPIQRGHNDTTESGTSNGNTNGVTAARIDRLRIMRNDRLPGAVLQARARLFERLRGLSLSRNRQITSSGISWDEVSTNNEILNETYESTFTVLNSEEHLSSIQDCSNMKPAGLSWEAFHSLRQETFEDGDASDNMGASIECAICLERFCKGDWLIQLNCGHRFHSPCLEPWVLTCGDCPYCRSII